MLDSTTLLLYVNNYQHLRVNALYRIYCIDYLLYYLSTLLFIYSLILFYLLTSKVINLYISTLYVIAQGLSFSTHIKSYQP